MKKASAQRYVVDELRPVDQLEEKLEELQSLNDEKNKFIGMAAHDLRNPVGNLLQLTELLLEEGENLTSGQQQCLEMMRSISAYAHNLACNLLDLSVIEAGKLTLVSSPTDVISLIQKTVEVNKLVAGKKGISISFTHATPSLIINIDPFRIEQVMYNLLTNAIKFSNPDSAIRIALECKNNQLLISVNDEGVGVKPGEKERLFRAFSHSSTGTHGEMGSGLGLNICKRIVEAHLGHIDFESTWGVGSTFNIRLPIASETAQNQ